VADDRGRGDDVGTPTVVPVALVDHLGLHSTCTSHGQPMYLISAYASWSLSYLLTCLSKTVTVVAYWLTHVGPVYYLDSRYVTSQLG